MKVSDKLIKVNDTITITMLDNGFTFEIRGLDHNDDWSTFKVVATNDLDVIQLFNEVNTMERDF